MYYISLRTLFHQLAQETNKHAIHGDKQEDIERLASSESTVFHTNISDGSDIERVYSERRL